MNGERLTLRAAAKRSARHGLCSDRHAAAALCSAVAEAGSLGAATRVL